ncbi:MAG: CoA-binding protein [Candidatus Nanopelagicales bacterium]
MTEDETIARVLELETWAVVGLRDNPARAAYGVARFLQVRGKRIVPVHPRSERVHGVDGVATLGEIAGPVDVVDVFVRSELAGDIVDQAIAIGAQAVWLQLGVIDQPAVERASAAGLLVVMDRCPAIEWPRLGKSTGQTAG